MRVSGVLTMVAVLGLAVPAVTSAQSLADLAAKEKERRERLKKEKSEGESKSFSETDLYESRRSRSNMGNETESANPSSDGESSVGEGETGGEAASGAGAEGAPAEKTEDEIRAEEQAAWREQLEAAEADRQRIDEEIATVQRALNDNTVNMYGSARQQRLQRLEEAKALKAEVEQRIAALEQEGRRNRFRR